MDDSILKSQQPLHDPEDLTRAILKSTSGSPCQRLKTLACDYVDGELDPAQASLVKAHLEHCAACTALVSVLRGMNQLLPSLAEVDPGPWFTRRILRVTLHTHHRDFGFKLRAAWSTLLHRPRIALETAYLGAAAGMMGLYLPHPTVPANANLPSLVRPLMAPTQRVVGPILQAEKRTAAALKRTFLPAGPPANQVSSVQSRWKILSSRVRGYLKRIVDSLRGPARDEKKPTEATNP